jgi:oxygen-dependent protoporphyrinogen oxidase
MHDLIIVGGGIAGLASAYYAVKKSSGKAAITLLEKADYWGGKIITDRVHDAVPDGDFVIEGGPDTFVVTKPWGVNLCEAPTPNTRKPIFSRMAVCMSCPGV